METTMKTLIPVQIWKILPAPAVLVGLAVLFACAPAPAASAPFGVPIRLSFKFILNASGNRPATGNLNTDAEIEAQIVLGNALFARFNSEMRMHNVEILEVSGASAYYNHTNTVADLDELRDAAMADPVRFYWRNNAINFYITGSGATAISDFPPNNNIVLCGQACFDTTITHEMGHSVSLYHTHDYYGDECSDTLPDNEDWDRNQIAVNAYGVPYSVLDTARQYQVDMVWSNIMSYHNLDDRCMISSDQLDRVSTQTYSDRNWLLTKVPVYVDSAAWGIQNGSFGNPYQNVQQPINTGELENKVLVLDAGTHGKPSSVITTTTDVVPRKGNATIKDAPPQYTLPCNLEESKAPRVRDAVVRAQQCDRQKDTAGVIANLREAEKVATGREKHALQLELAQRYRDAKQCDDAAVWFQKVADSTDQPKLRDHALGRVGRMKAEAQKAREKQTASRPQSEEAKPK
jgi:hypothetical protein